MKIEQKHFDAMMSGQKCRFWNGKRDKIDGYLKVIDLDSYYPFETTDDYFENCEPITEPKKVRITKRNELIGQVIERFRSGERFLISYDHGTWDNPIRFKFVSSDIIRYEWIAVDENWEPIGEPQMFTKECNK